MAKALFVGGQWHGRVREVPLEPDGQFPFVIEPGYRFWRFDAAGRSWPFYEVTGSQDADLGDAVRLAGWPTWKTPQSESLQPVRVKGVDGEA